MNPTTKATIEFVINKYKLREEHDTAGNLIDALKKDGKGTAVQHLTEAMAAKDYLSRSTLINNFLRDIEDVIPVEESFGSGVADIADDLKEIDKARTKEIEKIGSDKPCFSTKCFIVNPAGDSPYHAASREAMRAYAFYIQDENRALANEVKSWANKETIASLKRQSEKTSK